MKRPCVAPPASQWGTKLPKQLWPLHSDFDLQPLTLTYDHGDLDLGPSFLKLGWKLEFFTFLTLVTLTFDLWPWPGPTGFAHTQLLVTSNGPWFRAGGSDKISIAGPFQSTPARMNPARAPYGLAQDQPMVFSGGILPMHIPYGPQAGYVWAHVGSNGLPVRAQFKSLCKSSQIPYIAQTGLGTGRLGSPAQIPCGPWPGPGRARYLGSLTSTDTQTDRCTDGEWQYPNIRSNFFKLDTQTTPGSLTQITHLSFDRLFNWWQNGVDYAKKYCFEKQH